jgi:hypothetical protein
MNMQLDLDPTEADTLRATLALHLEELRQEWSHTDDHDFRHDLFRTIECLERVVARLPAPAAPARAAG